MCAQGVDFTKLYISICESLSHRYVSATINNRQLKKNENVESRDHVSYLYMVRKFVLKLSIER